MISAQALEVTRKYIGIEEVTMASDPQEPVQDSQTVEVDSEDELLAIPSSGLPISITSLKRAAPEEESSESSDKLIELGNRQFDKLIELTGESLGMQNQTNVLLVEALQVVKKIKTSQAKATHSGETSAAKLSNIELHQCLDLQISAAAILCIN